MRKREKNQREKGVGWAAQVMGFNQPIKELTVPNWCQSKEPAQNNSEQSKKNMNDIPKE